MLKSTYPGSEFNNTQVTPDLKREFELINHENVLTSISKTFLRAVFPLRFCCKRTYLKSIGKSKDCIAVDM